MLIIIEKLEDEKIIQDALDKKKHDEEEHKKHIENEKHRKEEEKRKEEEEKRLVEESVSTHPTLLFAKICFSKYRSM